MEAGGRLEGVFADGIGFTGEEETDASGGPGEERVDEKAEFCSKGFCAGAGAPVGTETAEG